jgi:hypothetical protein
MPKIVSLVRFQWFWVLVLGACLALPTCLEAQEGVKMKVKIVEVTREGDTVSVDPPLVKLKKNQDIVIWVTNGESLKITWKGVNPLTKLTCAGRFCGTLVPSDAPAYVRYKYTVTVDGQSLDPDVEVVP